MRILDRIKEKLLLKKVQENKISPTQITKMKNNNQIMLLSIRVKINQQIQLNSAYHPQMNKLIKVKKFWKNHQLRIIQVKFLMKIKYKNHLWL